MLQIGFRGDVKDTSFMFKKREQVSLTNESMLFSRVHGTFLNSSSIGIIRYKAFSYRAFVKKTCAICVISAAQSVSVYKLACDKSLRRISKRSFTVNSFRDKAVFTTPSCAQVKYLMKKS